jgi:Guanylate-kinase-associated protein (GKAP) protein
MAIEEEFSVDLEEAPEGRKVKFSMNAPTVEGATKRSLFEEEPPVNKTIEMLKKRASKRSSRSIDELSSMAVVTPPAKPAEMLRKRASKRSSRSIDDMSQLAAVTPPVKSPVNVSLLTPTDNEKDTPSKRRRTKQSSDLSNKKSKSANHYYTMLDDVTTHLRGVAQIWLDMKEQKGADLPDLANEMIDSATGQTNLLITKKFMQFRKLVGLYDRNAGEKKIYSDDLDGFWSMMYMQVDDLYEKFAELQTMADKGWHEEGAVKKPVAKKNGKKKKTRQPVATKSSGLLDFIRKTRMEKMQSGSSTETEAPPVEVPMTPTRQSRRLTLNYVTPRRRSDGCAGCTPSSKSAKKRSRRTQVEVRPSVYLEY